MGTFPRGLKFAYIRSEKDREDARQAIEEDIVTEHPNDARKIAWHDPWKLRGVPIVGVANGVGCAIPGSKPGANL